MEKLLEFIFEFFPVVIAVLVFLFRAFTKKDSAPETKKPSPQTGNTFDDLLKQITQKLNETQNAPQNQPEIIEKKKMTTSGITEKGLSADERKKDQHFSPYKTENKKKKTTEEIKLSVINEKQAKEIGGVEKGLSKKQRNTDTRFSAYVKKKKSKSRYSLMLQDRNKLKDAIILNEIFKRKYF
ncbi:MAG: hypothetical protein SFU27_00685 [Thermonemataceae bacterium]|nr:hypothetical protein [Thermonemataceae bacterium]